MTSSGDAHAVVSLTLSFQPLAEQIGSLRSALSDLCKPYLTEPDQLSRVLLAAHELLENIVKYSTGSSAEFQVTLEASDVRWRVRLRTKNRANPERLDDARRRLDALGAAVDPVAHYDELILASARSRDVSGLGLARIPAETEMQLRYSIEQDWLVLTAEGDASRGRAR